MVDETCSLCEDGKETLLHSLWYCEQAQTVWKSERSFVDLYKKQHRSFMDLFEMVNKEGSMFLTTWFATIAWSLWQMRNRIRERQTTWPLVEIGRRAKAMVEEYFDAQKPKPMVTPRPARVHWSPPTENLYKANFDSALFEHLGFTGLGVVVRDGRGNVLAALSQKIALPQSVEMAEALAAKRAVQLASEMSFLRVVVEGDCKRVVQAL